MEKCKVCGGADTCPDNAYIEVRDVPDKAVQYIPEHGPAPEGWIGTHIKKGQRIVCKLEPLPGYTLMLVGRAQAHRIYAHYGAVGRWVGACTYAFARPAGVGRV